jgi:hypothetical protein
MSFVLQYDGQHFRIDIVETASVDAPDKVAFVSWCSEGFKDLKSASRQSATHFVSGPPQPTYEEARRQAIDWIRSHREAGGKRPAAKARDLAQVIYTVWIFKRAESLGYEFEEFADAKAFASAAEKSRESTKVAITNNESPQYLTVWQRDH